MPPGGNYRYAILLLLTAAGLASGQSAEELKSELDTAFLDAVGSKPLRREWGEDWVLKTRQARPSRVVQAPAQLVDLHAHPFMERGLGLLFQGRFNGPLTSNHWEDRFSSQINDATLGASNLGVVVAALYAHPVLSLGIKDSIRRQIQDARAFVSAHPDWVLARTPDEARTAHRAGKRVMVLALEGAAGTLETEEDLREFVDRGGIRIVTFAHLSDDDLTGAALMRGFKRLANPGAASRTDAQGVSLNPMGLTDEGRRVARALIARKVWIDLSHATDSASAELIDMMRAAGLPLLFTHTSLRRHRKEERAISDAQLRQVAESGGILGLVPSEEVLEGTPVPPGRCKGGVDALAVQFNEAAAVLGPGSVFLGTDFNGAMKHLALSKCPTGTSLDRERGLYHIGQTPELWVAMRRAGADASESAFHGADRFIEVWSRVFAAP